MDLRILISLMYFDQYTQSHSPWSPDSEMLLFSGELGSQEVRTRLSNDESNRVYVVSVEDGSSLRDMAGGFIACWGHN